jgi:sulfate/thiosulfate transport system permease protein
VAAAVLPALATGVTAGWRRPSVIPGFGLALGITVAWLSLIVLVPLAALFIRAGGLGPAGLWAVATDPRVLAALELSFGAALVASLLNLVMGGVVAWALVRYEFPLKRLLDAVVDLPFALPTAVAGIALASLYAPNGWVGRLLEPLGLKVAFTPAGVVVALMFVGLPFVVRTVQPVLQDLEADVEEAAATLGANRRQTFRRVILPAIAPAMLTGFALAFARSVGEYGSVIFIAGNLPYVSEIAPLLIIIRLEEFDYTGATAVAAIMLTLSFAMLLAINLLQAWSRRHHVKR